MAWRRHKKDAAYEPRPRQAPPRDDARDGGSYCRNFRRAVAEAAQARGVAHRSGGGRCARRGDGVEGGTHRSQP